MPSKFQSGTDTTYASEHERHICEWPERWLLNLYPIPSVAQAYLGAANKHNASIEIKKHFAELASPE